MVPVAPLAQLFNGGAAGRRATVAPGWLATDQQQPS